MNNSKDDTPEINHLFLVPSEAEKILTMPKVFGNENLNATKMLRPGNGVGGVKDFYVNPLSMRDPINVRPFSCG
jgi:fumarate hydratase subunit alpha